MAPLPEQGELASTPLPRLLLDLGARHFDGRLILGREPQRKQFRFQQGAPISVESSLAADSLAARLLERGHLSRPDSDRVRATAGGRGVSEAAVLLELGLLGPRSLLQALRRQVCCSLIDCFGWPDGRWELVAEETPRSEAEPARSDPYALVQEGVETHWSAERMLADLSPHMDEIVTPHPRLERVRQRLAGDLDELVRTIDGTRSLWRVLESAHSPRTLASIWLFDAVGAIEYAKAEDPARARDDREIEIVRRGSVEEAPEAATEAADATAEAGVGQELALEISGKYVRLDELDHYALLGVGARADARTIRRAYLDAAKRFHPDALARAGLDRDTRAKAGRVFAAIGRAHAVLSQAETRRNYDLSLSSDDTDLDADRLAAAETNYRKGEILMRQGNFRGALEYLRPAVELWPEDATYQGTLGWALFKAPPSDPVRARAHLERAVSLEPGNPDLAEWLAVVRRALGE